MNVLFKSLPIAAALIMAGCGGGSDSGETPTFANETQTVVLKEDTAYTDQVAVTNASDDIRYILGSAANHGAVKINNNGEYTYTPDENYFGADSITITATNGSKSSRIVINFTVENVNDIPQLLSTSVAVTSSTTTEGQIEFYDPDGDSVTVKVLKAPEEGTLVLNENTGEFIYTAPTLNSISGSFTISYTDGRIETPLTAVINLIPSYVTNQDKHNYYYSSSKSHLKQAQVIANTINDDLILNDIREALSISYTVAGFEEAGQEFIDKMSDEFVRSQAYKALADKYIELGLMDKAYPYLMASFSLANSSLANKGVANITSKDTSFFYKLTKGFINANYVSEAVTVLNKLKEYALVVREDTYTSSYGYYLNGAYSATSQLLDNYLAEPTSENREQASLILDNYIELIELTPPYIQKRGVYKDEKQNQFNALHIARATQLAYQLGKIDLAKQLLNKGLSYYGIVGLDSAYPYTASPYSEATVGSYTYPLTSLSGLIVALYGEQETNPVYAKLTKSTDINNAKAAELKYIVLTKLLNGFSVDDAFAPLDKLYQDNADTRDYVSLILDADTGLMTLLNNLGETQLALKLVDKANTLISNDEYILQQLTSYISGYKGCTLITKHVANLGGDVAAQIQFCSDLVFNKLLSETKNTQSHISALNDLLKTHIFADDKTDASRVTNSLNSLNAEIARLFEGEDTEIKDQFKFLYEHLGSYIQLGELAPAQEQIKRSLAIYKQHADTLTASDRMVILKSINTYLINNQIDSSLSFIAQLSISVANIPDYQTHRAQVIAVATEIVNSIVDTTLQSSDKEIQDAGEEMVFALTMLNAYDKALQVVSSSAFAEADRMELNAQRALLIAQKDDFLGSQVASVDTDYDGRPNFFLPGVSQSEIDESGLVADDDADSDGIPDNQDITPIGN